MTEKSYGGLSGIPAPKNVAKAKTEKASSLSYSKEKISKGSNVNAMKPEEIEKLKKAGEIAKQVKELARKIIKKDVLLLDVANQIDAKILELGGKPAFPINLSINEIAAHSTPAYNDETKAHGLLKVDIGVHIDGFIADTAFSLDLEKSDDNKKMIEAAEFALEKAIKMSSLGVKLREIGKEIEKVILSYDLQPIRNLSGHSLEAYNLHSGITVPNTDNFQEYELEEGAYAIEPFSTSGAGAVINGKPSGIYAIEKDGNVRDNFAREVLSYIDDEYSTLPFCSRWLVKKFGTRALIALKRIEEAGIIHQYPQLIEKDRKPVAQAEHTIIITEKERIVTT